MKKQGSNFSSSLRLSFSFSLKLIAVLLILSGWTWKKAVEAQNLPPARYDGFIYEKRDGDYYDTIMIESFFDPVCPDTRDSWPPLKRALFFYGPKVWLLVHLLPLPYHDNAFAASRSLHIVNTLNTSFTFPLLEHFFKYQDIFYNDHTKNLSRVSVVEEIVRFAAGAVGNAYYPKIEAGFNDRQTDLKTRVSFKYSTSRGVYGTPTFFVNGFELPGTGSPIDYNGWRKIIDPLISLNRSKSMEGF